MIAGIDRSCNGLGRNCRNCSSDDVKFANLFFWDDEDDSRIRFLCERCKEKELLTDPKWISDGGRWSIYLLLIRPDGDPEGVVAVECFIHSFCDFLLAHRR